MENKRLFNQFQAQRREVEDRMKKNNNVNQPVSRQLFHGTSHSYCEKICKEGFNRSESIQEYNESMTSLRKTILLYYSFVCSVINIPILKENIDELLIFKFFGYVKRFYKCALSYMKNCAYPDGAVNSCKEDSRVVFI